jgi:uncharacterized protein DUF4331
MVAITLNRKWSFVSLALAFGAAALTAVLLRGAAPEAAKASSHAEAPLISQDPRADNTDLYAFVSPDRPDTVTMVANYIPLEAPASGPNFYSFDDNVAYDINIDNNGDSVTDLTYRFRFTTRTRNPNTFLYNVGPINSLGDPNWNRPQTYSVTLIRHLPDGSTSSQVLGENLPTPPDNVGPRSTPNYAALAGAAVKTLSDGKTKVFAGQRDDPFYVDLGSVFDLAGLRPFNPFHAIPLMAGPGRDALHNYSTHSIAIQVPIDQVTTFSNRIIGIYASASRQMVRVLRKDGTSEQNGPFVQVSRLGEPLINEAVIPLGKKDFWNRVDPENDVQFESHYLNPEVSRLENALYGAPAVGPPATGHPGGALMPIAETGRTDLVAILLTGVRVSPSFNLNFTGPRKADLLRLNTSIAPTAAAGHGNRLGVLAGDLAGFPNGRRLEDDVVDIELRAFAQGYGPILHNLLGLPDKTPNDLLGDGVDSNDKAFLDHFPYVAPPAAGYDVP